MDREGRSATRSALDRDRPLSLRGDAAGHRESESGSTAERRERVVGPFDPLTCEVPLSEHHGQVSVEFVRDALPRADRPLLGLSPLARRQVAHRLPLIVGVEDRERGRRHAGFPVALDVIATLFR